MKKNMMSRFWLDDGSVYEFIVPIYPYNWLMTNHEKSGFLRVDEGVAINTSHIVRMEWKESEQ